MIDSDTTLNPTKESIDTLIVSCDGREQTIEHPKIFLHFNKEGRVRCPYCCQEFEASKEKQDKLG